MKDIKEMKWTSAGHNIRQKDDRWKKQIMHWSPWDYRRGRRGPHMRQIGDYK